ncbi:MAG: P-loop NTPase [Planctomycetes bacterium]|nr:P-loop NTPase [Planctomycetota bacterium]
MKIFIVSDNQAVVAKLQKILARNNINCPLSNIISIRLAEQMLTRGEFDPELIFVAFSSVTDPVLAILKDLRKHTQAKLIAVGSANDPRKILQCVHAGPDDYLDQDNDLESQVELLLERLRSSMQSRSGKGKLITVMSSNGGAGCSMISTNLAFALAKNNGRSCLCDLDLRRGDLASLMNLKPRYSLIDVCSNVHKLDRKMFENSLLVHEGGVHLLASTAGLNDVQQVTSDAVEKIMQFARQSFPWVVVDLEDYFHREQFRVLQLSDVILLTFRLDFSSLRNARRTIDYLDKTGLDRSKIQLVVNQHGRAKELSTEEAESALRMKISHHIPDDPKTVILSFNRGVPALLDDPRSKVSKVITKLAESLLEPVKA